MTQDNDAFPSWEKTLKSDGGPAFPNPEQRVTGYGTTFYQSGSLGMTLRQYYAGQAIVAIIMADSENFEYDQCDMHARSALRYAYAMIKEGNKP